MDPMANLHARMETLTAEKTELEKEVQRLATSLEELRAREGFLDRQLRAVTLLSKSRTIGGGRILEAFKELNRAASRTLGIQRVSVWLFDEARAKICCADLYDAHQDAHFQGTELAARDYPIYFKELEQERIVDATDAVQDPRTAEFGPGYLVPLGIGSMLDVPIFVGGDMVGIICHEHTGSPRCWTLDEKHFASFAASLAALALEAHGRVTAEAAAKSRG